MLPSKTEKKNRPERYNNYKITYGIYSNKKKITKNQDLCVKGSIKLHLIVKCSVNSFVLVKLP